MAGWNRSAGGGSVQSLHLGLPQARPGCRGRRRRPYPDTAKPAGRRAAARPLPLRPPHHARDAHAKKRRSIPAAAATLDRGRYPLTKIVRIWLWHPMLASTQPTSRITIAAKPESPNDSIIQKPALGSGLIKLTEMAFGMTRDARKSTKSGVVPPVEGFDEADQRQLDRPSDRADLHGLLCRKPLKGFSLPAGLLRVSAQIRSDHFCQFNGSRP